MRCGLLLLAVCTANAQAVHDGATRFRGLRVSGATPVASAFAELSARVEAGASTGFASHPAGFRHHYHPYHNNHGKNYVPGRVYYAQNIRAAKARESQRKQRFSAYDCSRFQQMRKAGLAIQAQIPDCNDENNAQEGVHDSRMASSRQGQTAAETPCVGCCADADGSGAIGSRFAELDRDHCTGCCT